ncbi:MAG: hypothetical protein V3S16_03800 [Candidatus Desulfatibia sp.]|jgi:hypothetical protein|uniref:hypothetical protein n=1 Tax=Candidatus Desulfatibia sp. TaxID=3101189 RepID=UPI002F328C8C
METLTQKKISISLDQKQFLAEYKKWGFSDQSSIVRAALTRFIREITTKERKALMQKKAKELLPDYTQDQELTAFTDLDGEDFR